MERPLILITNDDGIYSAGLWELAAGLLPLGEVLIVAPSRQWSGAGRSLGQGVTGRIEEMSRVWRGQWIRAYAVDASPAQVVGHALTEIAPRAPSLAVSGINFGYNLATDITISGTVGAAMEAAAMGAPAIAVSVEVATEYHLTGDEASEYGPAVALTRHLAGQLLTYGAPPDVDLLNINVPSAATLETPWRLTRLSRRRFLTPYAPDRAQDEGRVRYQTGRLAAEAEEDSDLRAVYVDGVISVTLLSLDMTARAYYGPTALDWLTQRERLTLKNR